MKKIIFLLSLFISLYPAIAQQTDYFQWGKQIEIISAVTEELLNNYIEEPNAEILTNEAIKGLLKKTDRYTKYYDEQQMFEQRLRRSGKISGIGVSVRNKDKGLSIRDIFPGSPAEKSGLLIGDLIIEIDGKKLDSISYNAKLKLLKGKPGTTVKLKVKRLNKNQSFTLTRAIIEQKAVPLYKMLDNETGYIKLSRFTSKAYPEVLNALVDLKKNGARKIILDLRGNPGGLLSQAIKITSLFIPKSSLVTYTKGRFEKFNKEYHTQTDPIDEEIPLAVLINKNSASASEIVSGALQDYDRAVIVGDTSFGKGLVQRFFPLKYGTFVKITISKYYIPSGRQIQKIDYWHRDKYGNATKFKKDPSKVFYTENKRKVYEHGGITPDVSVRPEENPSLLKDLINNDYIFNFNTEFFHRNPDINPRDLKDDKLLEKFINYLKTNKIDPKSETEKYLEKTLKKAEKDKISTDIYRHLKELNQKTDEADFDKMRQDAGMRKKILFYLKKDLILRYEGPAAYENYILQDDEIIRRAMEILKNGSYDSILNK